MNGFKNRSIVLIVIFFLFTMGCAHTRIDANLTHGEYLKAEKKFKTTIENKKSISSDDLIRVCYTYSKLKKYNKLFSCLKSLEKNIENGDKIISTSVLNVSSIFPSDITLVPNLLKSEAYLETGNYVKAIDSAKKVYNSASSMSFGDKLNNWDRKYRIKSLSIIIMAYAFSKDFNNAEYYLKCLENEGIGYFGGYQTYKEKKYALSKAYMASGMYQKVLEFGGFGDLAVFLTDVFTLGILKIDAIEDKAFGYIELPKKYAKYKALFETGKTNKAKEGFDNLLKHPAIKSNGEIYWAILFNRGKISETERNISEAIGFYEKAIEIIESQRSTINTEANKIGFVGDKQKVYHHMILALIATGRHAAAFEYVERAKSRALVDLLAENRNLAPENSQIDSMLTELDRLELEAKVQRLSGENVKQRKERSIEIKEKVHAVAPELYSLVSVSVPSPSEIQSLIAPDETIIEYYYFGADLYVFIITNNDIKAQRLGVADLVGEVEDLRKVLEKPDSKSYSELSGKLYDRLIKPAEHLIHTTNLVIVPHGILHYLPFNALYDGKEYLIDRYCVSYLPSSSVMKFLKKRKIRGGERILVFGNPDLGDPSYDLIYAEKEALTISNIFPESKLFLKSEATETAFKNVGGDFNYIHFACHGMFDAGSPLNSGIYLRKDSENDGRLTVGELYSTRLDAELVTLSACETGMGTIKQGDDVVGLTRGFLYAGSNSIIASLWKVDDVATSQLMAKFYSCLGRTGKREALREAQLTVKAQYKHPYYWAAFQITGKTE